MVTPFEMTVGRRALRHRDAVFLKIAFLADISSGDHVNASFSLRTQNSK